MFDYTLLIFFFHRLDCRRVMWVILVFLSSFSFNSCLYSFSYYQWTRIVTEFCFLFVYVFYFIDAFTISLSLSSHFPNIDRLSVIFFLLSFFISFRKQWDVYISRNIHLSLLISRVLRLSWVLLFIDDVILISSIG